MTITLVTVPGDLDDRSDPIVFTATRPVVSIAFEFAPESEIGARETAYDGTGVGNEGGTFAYLYRNSTHVGNTWTIRREGGWPAEVQLRAKEATSSGGNPSETLYEPIGQWFLAKEGGGSTDLTDRSGNGRDLTETATPKLTPDLLPGYTAPSEAHYSQTDAVFRIAGAMTATFRAWTYTTDEQLILAAAASGESSAANILYRLGLSPTGLTYFAERNSGADIIHFFTGILPQLGVWQFYALRRDGSGAVTVDLDDATATESLLAPNGGSSCVLTIGRSLGTLDINLPWLGGFADITLYDKRLSDVELAAVRASMFGGGA